MANMKINYVKQFTKNTKMPQVSQGLEVCDLNEQLCIASRNRDYNKVEKLLKEGADITEGYEKEYDNIRETLLMTAAETNDVELCQALLRTQNINVNKRNLYGNTALHEASKNGHAQTVEVLLQRKGIDVNIENTWGYTSLLYAAWRNYEEVVKNLLGVPEILVNKKDKFGQTALHGAAGRGHWQITKSLLNIPEILVNERDNVQGCTPLHLAVEYGHSDSAESLLNHPDIDVNVKDQLGQTPLHVAAYHGNLQLVEMLLKAGINVKEKSNAGLTAAQCAAEKCYVEIVEKIVNHIRGVELQYVNDNITKNKTHDETQSQKTPKLPQVNQDVEANAINTQLLEASRNGDSKKVEKLLKAGINVKEKINLLLTAAKCAAEKCYIEIVEKKVNHIRGLELQYVINSVTSNKSLDETQSQKASKLPQVNQDVEANAINMQALKIGDSKKVEKLLRDGADIAEEYVKEYDAKRQTLLMKSVETNNVELCEAFISDITNVNTHETKFQKTSKLPQVNQDVKANVINIQLLEVSRIGDSKKVEKLLGDAADIAEDHVKEYNANRQTVLMKAAETNNVELCEAFISDITNAKTHETKAQIPLVNQDVEANVTNIQLLEASRIGDSKKVEQLLSDDENIAKEHVKEYDANRQTVLMKAAETNNVELCEAFISDITNAKTHETKAQIPLVNQDVEANVTNIQLLEASRIGDSKKVEQLLSDDENIAKEHVKEYDANRQTVLMKAAETNNVELCEAFISDITNAKTHETKAQIPLVNQDVEANVTNIQLLEASRIGDSKKVEQLLSDDENIAKEHVKEYDANRQTVLMKAAETNNVELCEAFISDITNAKTHETKAQIPLVNQDVEANVTNIQLLEASRIGDSKKVEQLLSDDENIAKDHVKEYDANRQTVLMKAAETNNVELCEAFISDITNAKTHETKAQIPLVNQDVEANVTNIQLLEASRIGDSKKVEQLLSDDENIAKEHVKEYDANRQTVLMKAAETNNVELCEAFISDITNAKTHETKAQIPLVNQDVEANVTNIQLLEASRIGDSKKVEQLLSDDENIAKEHVKEYDANRQTVLMKAAETNNVELCEAFISDITNAKTHETKAQIPLVNQDVEANVTNIQLLEASRIGDSKKVEQLLSDDENIAKEHVKEYDANRQTVLMKAAETNNVELCEAFISDITNAKTHETKSQKTSKFPQVNQDVKANVINIQLLEASRIGDSKKVEKLLRDGADIAEDHVKEYNAIRQTLLMKSAETNNVDLCEAFVSNITNVKTHDGTKFQKTSKLPQVNQDVKANVINIQLLEASRIGDSKKVEKLLRDGADIAEDHVKEYNAIRQTLLMKSAETNDTELCEALLHTRNIDVNKGDHYGNTALHVASEKGHVDIVELLLQKRGIDVNAGNIYGNTSLIYAAMANHEEVVEKLLSVPGILVNKKDNSGQTALHATAAGGFIEATELLLKAPGILVNEKEALHSSTPLHLAVYFGFSDLAEALLNHRDIDVNAKDKYGITALHTSACHGNLKVVEMLLKARVNAKEKSAQGHTAVQWAAKNGHTNIVETIMNYIKCTELPNVNQGAKNRKIYEHKSQSMKRIEIPEGNPDILG
ncbi:serine/threonine-protein phosphatase 6 regulatory ankyrin repeat subunit A-like [Uloborus diversus]|uniref:serine/threonine-protein phosphatase 6 regulatory ankyrin repeat subunit A-like n=1 Tax=Uloborus diversus TaxID=327109 RepID=UPI002409B11C|nr:serine/threonine-protein phosphatase 6 regulatory ankyrin repeat subunit A-like [Uloborus diversus]